MAPGDKWRVRRRAVAPSLHKAYLQTMIDRVFGPCAKQLNSKLEVSPTAKFAGRSPELYICEAEQCI